MVMWKPMGRIRRLHWLLVRLLQPLLLVEVLSAKFSAQSELINFFDFSRLAVTDKNGHDPSLFCEGI